MLQFLTAVLPATGGYVLTAGTPKADGTGSWFKNYHCDTLAELEGLAKKIDAQPGRTVYFALANYKDNEDEDGKIRRTAAHAQQFKTLAFDVDPKGRDGSVVYGSQREMASAVLGAVAALGVPDPIFVSSGNGLHCYYPLEAPISKRHWHMASELLRDALTAQGLVLDTTKISDPSMVLRPVGTHNKKDPANPLPVKLLSPLKFFDLVTIVTALQKAVPGSKHVPPKSNKARASTIADAILNTEFPPADASLIETRCAQVAAVSTTRGNVDEPTWYAALGIAAFSISPEVVAVAWSDGHPGYKADQTLAKMAQWKARSGPTTCAHFEKLNPSGCATCPHRGRIGSPIQLGVQMVSDATAVAAGTPELVLPKGYIVRGEKVYRMVGEEAMPVSDYLLYPTYRYKDQESGKAMCLIQAKIPIDGWKTYELPMDLLATGSKDWSSWLLNNQLYIHNEEMLKATRRYVMTYLQELQQESSSHPIYSSFGWADDECKSFVLGDRLVTADETIKIRLAPTAASISTHITPKGDLEKWAQATQVFDMPGLAHHAMFFLCGAASPLMRGSGLKNMLVNIYSTDSGTGKTTTGHFYNSIYGNPEKLSFTVEDTQNATFKTMGVYGNLPVYIDEITMIPADRLRHTLFFITQGREKKRMRQDGSFQEVAEWESITGASSNKDVYALLADRMAVDGETMRVLQLPVGPNPLFNGETPIGAKLASFLLNNHGLAGETLIRTIIKSGGPYKIFEEAHRGFAAKFKFDFAGKERFWQAAIVCGYAMGKLGQALGLFRFDVDAAVRETLNYIASLRNELGLSKLDAFDIIGLYASEHASKFAVHVTNTDVSRIGRVLLPYPNEAVGRIEMSRTNRNPYTGGRIFLNAPVFNRWCHDRGADVKNIFAQLLAFGVTIHKERKINLMRGTDKPMPAVRAYEIVMNHPRFATALGDIDAGDQVQLGIVQGATA